MHWSLVKFPEENTVEVVPTTWYVKESKECFWPPRDIKRHRIATLIRHCEDPQSDWKIYAAELLGQYNDLDVAQKKAKRAELTSDLSSNNESAGRGYRPRKKNVRYQSKSSDDSSVSSDDDNRYPRTKVLSASSVAPSSLFDLKTKELEKVQEETNGTNVTGLKVVSEKRPREELAGSLTRRTASPGTNSVIKNPPEGHETDEAGFKEAVMQELSLINLKLDTLIDRMTSLTKCFSLNSINLLPETDKNLEDFHKLVPIKTTEDMAEVENWLKQSKNYKIMLMELNRIGGTGMSQSVRKILYRIVDNQVAKDYSWDGAKGKKAFKNLKIANAILETIKLQYRETTETEIIMVIKIWLVKANERIKQKQKQAESNIEDACE